MATAEQQAVISSQNEIIPGHLHLQRIRQYRPDAVIYAWDPDQLALRIAQQEGVVNERLLSPDTAVARGRSYFPEDTSVVFLSAPVEDNLRNLAKIRSVLNRDMILTDVGSVKGPVHHAVKASGLSDIFVGGHPMAGTERSGYRNSKALLLENAYYILTPAEECPEEKREFMHQLVADLRAAVWVLHPGVLQEARRLAHAVTPLSGRPDIRRR